MPGHERLSDQEIAFIRLRLLGIIAQTVQYK
jgi:hypothetical protein